MHSLTQPAAEPATLKSSVALGNLRGLVILIVLAFHSMLAYLASLPASTPTFDAPPYRWQAFPIVDSERWLGFDLFCAWNDVYLMSLMFFLSGLFTWPSLSRKGTLIYLRDRLTRLALPLAAAEFLLMPIALFPTYVATASSPSLAGYWNAWMALPFWPCGPQWFLWQLLAFNIVAAIIYRFAPGCILTLAGWARSLGASPARFFLALAIASAFAYVPLALVFSPWRWSEWGPFALPLSRPLHYCVYFVAGIASGASRLNGGLWAADGTLPRDWAKWLAVAGGTFLLWIIPMALIVKGGAPDSLPMQAVVGIAWSLACAGSCIFALAFVLRFAALRVRALDSLSRNAYTIYLIHYPFVVWLQYAMLGHASPAALKAAIVFGGTLILSWSASAAIGRLAGGARLIGSDALARAR